MTACPWCGYPACDGPTPIYPHHSLCCLDGGYRACWGRVTPARDRTTTEGDAGQYARSSSEPEPRHDAPTRSEAERDERGQG